ncbi:hypothetical protein BDY24DRAFT_376846 [Mrakia frigida]|uniref:uncharacterized protein n=1 Tax=Mrakia frigida TaxID=29902 RepID=UPI003FCBF193
MSEQESPPTNLPPPVTQTSSAFHRKHVLGQKLESKPVHGAIIFLIALDACFVLADLFYTVLHNQCTPEGVPEENPRWLEILEIFSIVITTIFLVEIPLALYAFGTRFFNPFGPVTHAGFHLFDAILIVGTFTLEVALHGRERELAGLLILLRLWRLIKLVGGVAVGVGELDEESLARLLQTEQRLNELELELAEERRVVVEVREHLRSRGDEVGLGVVERKGRGVTSSRRVEGGGEEG